jgi:hypothetical protein
LVACDAIAFSSNSIHGATADGCPTLARAGDAAATRTTASAKTKKRHLNDFIVALPRARYGFHAISGARGGQPGEPWERATDRERAHRALAALATLKRDEARALVLQAAGRTYAEIEAETGWSHTKVNRALTEGRAAFRTLVSALEAGDECARHAPLLRAVARGRAPADAILGLRAHLRACGACRATLAELR